MVLCTLCICGNDLCEENKTDVTGKIGDVEGRDIKRQREMMMTILMMIGVGGGVTYVKTPTALTASANICHFRCA